MLLKKKLVHLFALSLILSLNTNVFADEIAVEPEMLGENIEVKNPVEPETVMNEENRAQDIVDYDAQKEEEEKARVRRQVEQGTMITEVSQQVLTGRPAAEVQATSNEKLIDLYTNAVTRSQFPKGELTGGVGLRLTNTRVAEALAQGSASVDYTIDQTNKRRTFVQGDLGMTFGLTPNPTSEGHFLFGLEAEGKTGGEHLISNGPHSASYAAVAKVSERVNADGPTFGAHTANAEGAFTLRPKNALIRLQGQFGVGLLHAPETIDMAARGELALSVTPELMCKQDDEISVKRCLELMLSAENIRGITSGDSITRVKWGANFPLNQDLSIGAQVDAAVVEQDRFAVDNGRSPALILPKVDTTSEFGAQGTFQGRFDVVETVTRAKSEEAKQVLKKYEEAIKQQSAK